MTDNLRRIDGVLFINEFPNNYGQVTFWCPGCEAGHTIGIGGNNAGWGWNGDTQKPTFEPSVLSHPMKRSFDEADPENESPKPLPGCHSFVRDGKIEYLSDSEHDLAGKTVDMVPLPERYAQFLMEGEK